MGEGSLASEASNKDTEIHFWLAAVGGGGFETWSAKATAKICLLGARHRMQTNIRSNSECQGCPGQEKMVGWTRFQETQGLRKAATHSG